MPGNDFIKWVSQNQNSHLKVPLLSFIQHSISISYIEKSIFIQIINFKPFDFYIVLSIIPLEISNCSQFIDLIRNISNHMSLSNVRWFCVSTDDDLSSNRAFNLKWFDSDYISLSYQIHTPHEQPYVRCISYIHPVWRTHTERELA